MCLSCANSIFPFHSLANNELSDLFNEGFLSKISSGIIVYPVADHLPIFQTSVIGKLSPFQKNVMQCFSPQYLLQFQRSVEQVDFTTVFQESDPDQSYAQFHNLMNNKVKNCFTLKCSKNRPNSCKRYDKELAKLLHKKDRLYKQYITTGSSNLKAKYQKLRNLYFNTINYKKKRIF